MRTIEDFAEQFARSAVPQAILDTSVGCVSLAVNPSHAVHFKSEEPVRTKDEFIQRINSSTDSRILSCHCEEIQAVEALDLEQCVFLRMQRQAVAIGEPVRDIEYRMIEQNGLRNYQVYCADAQLLPQHPGALAVALQPAPEYQISVETLSFDNEVWRLGATLRYANATMTNVPPLSLAHSDAPTYFAFVTKLQRARTLLHDNNIADAFRVLADLEEAYKADYPKRTLIVRLRYTDPNHLATELEHLWARVFDYYALTRLVTAEFSARMLAQVPPPPAYDKESKKYFSFKAQEAATTPAPSPLKNNVKRVAEMLGREPYATIIKTITNCGPVSSGDVDTRLRAPGARAAIDELVNTGLLAFESNAYCLTPYGQALANGGDCGIARTPDLDDLMASIDSLQDRELLDILAQLSVPRPIDRKTTRELRHYFRGLVRQWAETNDPTLQRLCSLVAEIEIQQLNSSSN